MFVLYYNFSFLFVVVVGVGVVSSIFGLRFVQLFGVVVEMNLLLSDNWLRYFNGIRAAAEPV